MNLGILNKKGEFLGGAIAPGIRLMMESLQENTAKLFGVNIVKPEEAIGKNTKTAIQSGIYYAQLGLIEQIIKQTIIEHTITDRLTVVATGGFSNMFGSVFEYLVPELVLLGIKQMLEMN